MTGETANRQQLPSLFLILFSFELMAVNNNFGADLLKSHRCF